MHRLAALALLLAAVALAGCTTAGTGSSSGKFKGAQGDVATVVSDLQKAAQRHDGAKICSQILAATLVDRLSSGGTQCIDEVTKAARDADDFKLTVLSVTVSSSTATAKVRNGDKGPTRTLGFVKESNRWKVSELSSS